MNLVAKSLGLESTYGQSPFALARGQQFEKELFRAEGRRLLDELVAQEVLPEGATGFLDLRLRINGGARVPTLESAIAETERLLRRVSEGADDLPSLVAGATVRVPKGVMLPEAILIVDALTIRTDGPVPTITVGEIKTYPDRGGHTDAGDLALARAQAGIYVNGLDVVIAGLGLAGRAEISRTGFLVLTRPGSNQPSVRSGEDLRYQAERARRGFELLERAASELPAELWAPSDDQAPERLIAAVATAETAYEEKCLSFCELAARCFRRAVQAGDPVILGERVQRFLGRIRLPRAMELLDGEEPQNDAERDFLTRIADAATTTGT